MTDETRGRVMADGPQAAAVPSTSNSHRANAAEPRPAERRLRRFLLWTAGFIWLGSIAELLLTEHTGEWIQYVPFVVCAVGVVAVGAVLRVHTAQTRRLLRLTGIVAILASAVGAWKHYEANLELELEIHATASRLSSMWEALFGASPFLAPGILALAGVLAIAALWEPAEGGGS